MSKYSVIEDYRARYGDAVFSSDYISYKIEVLTSFLGHFSARTDVGYLEVGAFEGLSTIWILNNLLSRSKIPVHIVDSFYDAQTENLPSNLKKAGLAKRCVIHRGESGKELKKFENDSFELIMIDGCHQTSCALEDLVLAWPLLEIGGYMIIDDYKLDTNDAEIKPWIAIDAFLQCYAEEIEVLYKEYFIIVRKKPRYAFPLDLSLQPPKWWRRLFGRA